MIQIKWSEKILPAFKPVWKADRKEKHLRYVLKGGRNSSKSTHIAILLVKNVMRTPANALCVRKVGNTLEESVCEQIIWAIHHLNVEHLFHISQGQGSQKKIVYLPRGNRFYFRGADKPEKIKSIKTSRFPISLLWFEELAEFKSEDDVTTIENSIMRATLPNGLTYKFYYSYNPPKRKQSWVNKKYNSNVDLSENTFVHHSTYKDNPHVSKEFIGEANEVKEKNPMKYRWEYLGEAIGAGVVPFDNLEFREITNNEISTFDNIKQGLDFGYAVDPAAFVRMHYDKKRRRLYIFDEFYKVKASNRELAEWIIKQGYHKTFTIADSAEPKSVDEIKSYGVRIKGAKKGPGSVEHGEKWLDDLDAIIIDPKRCPNAAKEFENIDYATDQYGDVKNRLEDENNHAIDSTRYGCEDDMKYSNRYKAAKSVPGL